MRTTLIRTTAVLALLASVAVAGDAVAFKSDDLNFEITVPEDSVDWEAKEIDNKAHPQLRVHFYSGFADSQAYAAVQVMVLKMSSKMARNKLKSVAAQWKAPLEGHLANPRERKERFEQFAGVDSYFATVKGDFGSGITSRSWRVMKNGNMLYTIIVDRHLAAVKDEDITEEVGAIIKSFKFGEIRKVTGDRKAKGGAAPNGPGQKGKGAGEASAGDPELLKKLPVSSTFWRYKCTKPAGILEQKLTDNDAANGIKNSWMGDKNQVRFGIRVFAWSLKKRKYTIDQLVKSKLEWWKTRVKQTKKPIRKDKYKAIPLTKKGTYLELIGRAARRERFIYIIIECKNDRMYLLEIYSMGDTGDKNFGKSIEAFIKSFKPQKK